MIFHRSNRFSQPEKTRFRDNETFSFFVGRIFDEKVLRREKQISYKQNSTKNVKMHRFYKTFLIDIETFFLGRFRESFQFDSNAFRFRTDGTFFSLNNSTRHSLSCNVSGVRSYSLLLLNISFHHEYLRDALIFNRQLVVCFFNRYNQRAKTVMGIEIHWTAVFSGRSFSLVEIFYTSSTV